jgi:hypothetical protein
MKNIIVGIFVGWLTLGILFASNSILDDWRVAKIIILLEEIAENTRD